MHRPCCLYSLFLHLVPGTWVLAAVFEKDNMYLRLSLALTEAIPTPSHINNSINSGVHSNMTKKSTFTRKNLGPFPKYFFLKLIGISSSLDFITISQC